MVFGELKDYFEGLAYKTLSLVEADPGTSNQHELNGVTGFKQLFGIEKKQIVCTFLYFSDDADFPLKETGFLT